MKSRSINRINIQLIENEIKNVIVAGSAIKDVLLQKAKLRFTPFRLHNGMGYR